MGAKHTVGSTGKEGTDFNFVGVPTFKDLDCKAKRNRKISCSQFHPVGTNRCGLPAGAQ